MPNASFVHLRVRSSFSLLEGSVQYSELAEACRTHSMPAVAVTDTANLFGAMQFCNAALALGVQPIVGVTLFVSLEDETNDRERSSKPRPVGLLAKSEDGYANMLKLMSEAYLNSEANTSHAISVDQLCLYNEGLILLTGGADGPIGQAICMGDRAQSLSILKRFHASFDDRLYLEITRQGKEVEEVTEATMLDMAFDLNVPIVATNDIYFLDEGMHEAHDALICIAQGARVDQEDRQRFSLDYRFKSAKEMADLFSDLPEAIENTLAIAHRCAFATPARPPILPRYVGEEGRNEDEELRAQARRGLENRLRQIESADESDSNNREEIERPYRERLEYELDVIVQMQFPGYFLIVSDFIRWAKSQEIPVGPGRGSGAGSVVAWSLDITDLDPLRFGLLFERFLNPERVSMPDFDIDFCQDRRDEVIRYVRDKYGADRVANIITFGKLQARAALRDVGRVLGLPFGQVDRICKMVPFNPANPPTLKQALDLEPRLVEARDNDPSVAKMLEIALKLEGLPRHASTHAAGVVIGDRPLDELIPLYRDPRSEMPVTQFNMKDVEKAGLVKFDFLGLTTLTMLELAEQLVIDRGQNIELASLPLDNQATYSLLASAETSGVFQLESGGMRDALRKLKADCFEDIIAMVSLYRPGPMDNIPRYINVKHGIEDPSYLHPTLEPILGETNGVIIYQEQVMEIAKQLAGYSLGSADLLRRAMGKKIKAEMDQQRSVFVEGSANREIEDGLANTIFDQVAKFASYGFNKSHAAAYALLAYQTAYLKANHPVEFYASVMTMEMANQPKLGAYRQEIRGRDLELFPPDVNRSMPIFSVEDREQNLGVRFALAAIKGVGRQAMQALVDERKSNGAYKDLFDLARRLGTKIVNKRILENLIKAGALDCFEANRHQQFLSIERALRDANAHADAIASSQVALFSADGSAPPPKLIESEEWPALERLSYEFETLGLYHSAHPLDGYKAVLDNLDVNPASDILDGTVNGDRGLERLAGVLVAIQEKKTERGRFAFARFSDATAQFEIMIYAELLERARDSLTVGRAFVITVDVRADNGEVRLTASAIEPIELRADQTASEVEIALENCDSAIALKPLLTVENERKGALVQFVIPAKDDLQVVLALPEVFALCYSRRTDAEEASGVTNIKQRARSMGANSTRLN